VWIGYIFIGVVLGIAIADVGAWMKRRRTRKRGVVVLTWRQRRRLTKERWTAPKSVDAAAAKPEHAAAKRG
jgi:hypothetical protein